MTLKNVHGFQTLDFRYLDVNEICCITCFQHLEKGMFDGTESGERGNA
jgi:hypothetical protein